MARLFELKGRDAGSRSRCRGRPGSSAHVDHASPRPLSRPSGRTAHVVVDRAAAAVLHIGALHDGRIRCPDDCVRAPPCPRSRTIAASSANESGAPTPATAGEVAALFPSVSLVVDGAPGVAWHRPSSTPPSTPRCCSRRLAFARHAGFVSASAPRRLRRPSPSAQSAICVLAPTARGLVWSQRIASALITRASAQRALIVHLEAGGHEVGRFGTHGTKRSTTPTTAPRSGAAWPGRGELGVCVAAAESAFAIAANRSQACGGPRCTTSPRRTSHESTTTPMWVCFGERLIGTRSLERPSTHRRYDLRRWSSPVHALPNRRSAPINPALIRPIDEATHSLWPTTRDDALFR